MELLLTGERYDAKTALQFGLVSRVVPAKDLLATADEIAGKILECGPLAVQYIKQAAYEGLSMTFADGVKLEAQFAGKVFTTEDAREGPRAFAAKRDPVWTGEYRPS